MRLINEKPSNPVEYWGKNQKILSVFDEKLLNLNKKWGKKTKKDQTREKSKTFLLA